jgi:poly-gamma-glutamate synthesis protein (capsule biosynthesis protein)
MVGGRGVVARGFVHGFRAPRWRPTSARKHRLRRGFASGRVFVYRHDHYWEQDWQVTPEWKKTFARACIDSGATTFISHGAPLLHGIEIYRQRPIFYDLGNFIFQLWTHLNRDLPPRYRERVVWQSVIAQCRFRDGRLRALRLDPIVLKDVKEQATPSPTLDGNPRLANGAEAREIPERLQSLSNQYGTRLEVRADHAEVKL